MVSSDLSSGDGFRSDRSRMDIKISTEVVVAAAIFLFLLVVFVFFLYLYVKNYSRSNIVGRRRSQFIFVANDSAIPSRGLDPSVVRSLPVNVYRRSDFKDGLECSVCLCELSNGEEMRLLPKCNHAFHLQCIDMWFQSHSTCPLCRSAVGSETVAVAITGDGSAQSESTDFPTNVLFWGNQNRVNSRSNNSNGSLIVLLPNRIAEGFQSPSPSASPSPMSPLPPSRFTLETLKSSSDEARTPGSSKLRALRGIWSRGRRTGASSCSSPMGGDIEQGFEIFGISNGEGTSNSLKTSTIS